MALPAGPIPSFKGGFALTNQDLLQKLAQLIGSTQTGVVAKAGGTQATATLLTGAKVKVDTVTTAADAVKLPPGYPGLELTVWNNGNQSMQVFGSGKDTINGVATATGVSHANAKTAIYTCYEVVAGVGHWSQLLSA